ncbi:MAG: hypothetical protein RLZZ546_2186, partial [Bacteroidota bacterium]
NIYDEINKLKIFISDKEFKELILFLSEHKIYKNNPVCKLFIENEKNYILPYEIEYINLIENLLIKEIKNFINYSKLFTTASNNDSLPSLTSSLNCQIITPANLY